MPKTFFGILPPVAGSKGQGKGEKDAKADQQAKSDKQIKEDDMTRSMQIGIDERFLKMNHYRNHGGSKADHFSRLTGKNRQLQARGDKLKSEDVDEEVEFKDLMAMEEEVENDEPWQIRKKPACSVNDRVEWQESFDRKVNNLFMDFQLSDAPHCRLNHLERMDKWFSNHGAKQTRKATRGPSYLTVEKGAVPPIGSARTIPSSLGSTSQILAGSYTPRNFNSLGSRWKIT